MPKTAAMKRVAISVGLGGIAMLLSFALIFGGGLIWEDSRYPHDGQAGMGPFFLGVLLAPVIGVIVGAAVLHKLQR